MTSPSRIPLFALALALALSVAAPSLAQALRPDEDRRVETYERFRALFDAGKYEEALPLAQSLVGLTEAADPQHEELPTAYNNLGVVQFRLGDLDGAESSFDTALETLEKMDELTRLLDEIATDEMRELLEEIRARRAFYDERLARLDRDREELDLLRA